MKQEVSASSTNQSFVGPSYNVDKGCVLKHKSFKYDNKKIKKKLGTCGVLCYQTSQDYAFF